MNIYFILFNLMTSLSEEYTFAGEAWLEYEDKQLIQEYTVDNLPLMEISKIHKRLPGGIVSRLRKLNLVAIRSQTRGYLEYQQSELYKEICRNNGGSKRSRMKKINNLIHETLPPLPLSDTDSDCKSVSKRSLSEISLLKKDISEINKKVDKILELMNALYDFESGQ